MYNEKLEQAYTKANYVSEKKKYKREKKAEGEAQRRGWLRRQDVE